MSSTESKKTEADLAETGCPSAHGDDLDTSDAAVHLDPRVRRKVDLRIVPLVTITYLCCFLDRSNLGNARIAGMAEDLDLVGMRYQIAASAFFITYGLLEVPCNVLFKLMRPSIWIPSLTVGWGVVMMTMSAVQTWHGLIIARLFLGIAESGLAPALAFLITSWYRREDQARPIAGYFSAASLAGAFGGLFAFAIEKLNGRSGLHGWQWIFLIEGLLTVVVGLFMFLFLVDYPDTAKFLTPNERDHLLDVLKRDMAGQPLHFDMRFVWETLGSPKSWLMTAIYIGFTVPIYSFALFLPTIIDAMGFSSTHAQLLTVPPNVLAFITMLSICMLSDRAQMRGLYVAGTSLLGITGFIIFLKTNPKAHPYVAYAGAMIAAAGMYPGIPLTLAWSAGNAGGSLKKAVITAMIGTVANLGGICSSFVYRTQDTPRFVLGHSVSLGFMCMALIGSIVAVIWFRAINNNRDLAPKGESPGEELGTESPHFRFML
ncbi:Transporter C1683 12 [Mycena chlorophos]|uniref:Transporter C1683 12 n=1 Tax=Mycena chlorophos TaxID=658473 RepID=A0A8H6RYP8_MYCCL|nr:Transporter C1683 12 [Mycena chlorophos]